MASRHSFLTRGLARWHIARANSARDGHNWLKARSHYSRALALTPGRADIWVQLGHAEKESGALREAGEAYDRAVALQPHVADTYLQIGHLRKLQGDLDAAAESYARAFQLDQTLSDAAAGLQCMGRTPPETDAERILALEASLSSTRELAAHQAESLSALWQAVENLQAALVAQAELAAPNSVMSADMLADVRADVGQLAARVDSLAEVSSATAEELKGALTAHKEHAAYASRTMADLRADLVEMGGRIDTLAERSSLAAEFGVELSSTRAILGKVFERLAAVEHDLAALRNGAQAFNIRSAA